jgi:hypothetical protein
MPRVEIEFDDTGNVVGEAPAPFLAYLERENTKVYGTAFKNGVAETQTKTAKQFEETLKAELAKKDALAPMERAKFAQLEEENKILNSRFTESITNHTKTLREQEEAHARKVLQQSEAVSARNKRIDALVASQLEGLAIAYGAREESLPELKVILKNYIGYTDDYEPFIKGEDGNPRMTARGERVEPKAFVKEYLDTHPHHRKPASTGGGNARGGASVQGYNRETVSIDAARNRVNSGDRSPGAINELFEASRKRANG